MITNLAYLWLQVIVERAEKSDVPEIDKKKLVFLCYSKSAIVNVCTVYVTQLL